MLNSRPLALAVRLCVEGAAVGKIPDPRPAKEGLRGPKPLKDLRFVGWWLLAMLPCRLTSVMPGAAG